MKGNVNIFKTDAFSVKLAKNQSAVISCDKTTGLIKYGKKNDHADMLLFLFSNHPEHGGIVRGKARYITGKDVKPKSGDVNAINWLKKANPVENWLQVKRKCDLDKVVFGGYYIKVQTNALGTPIYWYHIEWGKVRKFIDGSYVICDDYKNYSLVKKTFLKPYTVGSVGTFIYEYKSYSPSTSKLSATYPKPEYEAGILDIDTDIRVGTFFNSIVKNNFSAGTIITIFNGETDPKKKQAIVEGIRGENEGEDEAGKTAVVFVNKDSKGTEITRVNANDLDKQYQEVNKRNLQKIVSAHNVPAGLFKIKLDSNALLGRDEIALYHELFINEYAKVEQVPFNDTLAYFYKISTGKVDEFEVEQIDLIGVEIPLDNQNIVNALTKDELRKIISSKFNLELADLSQSVIPSEGVQAANETLTNLTGRQFQNLMRIVNKHDKGIISREAAIMMLKSAFGLNDEQAALYIDTAKQEDDAADLEVKQSDQKEKLFFDLLAKYSHPVVDDEILEEYEVKNHNFKLSETFISDSEKNSILDQIKGNPFASVDDIAKQLNLDVEVVKESIQWLTDKSLIEANEGVGYTPTEKALDVNTDTSIEIYTEYTYELRPDAPTTNNGKKIISRDFCQRMVSLYGSKSNAISYDAIVKMKNDFGDNVWDFKGGFYTNGNTKLTTPWCRHFWKATVKSRKKTK